MNVSAEDKSTKKSNKITITNDTGRLTKDQIERMINSAKQFEEEDKKHLECIESRNKLQGLVSSMRQSLNQETIKEKLSSSEIELITKQTKEKQEWIDNNSNATKDEIEGQIKELEQQWHPLMNKIYAGQGPESNGEAGTGAFPGGFPAGFPGDMGLGRAPNSNGPKVEEVD